MDVIEPLVIIVSSIKDIISIWLIGNFIHHIHIVYLSGSDMEECWNLSLQVIQGVDFYSALCLAELGPPEDAKA